MKKSNLEYVNNKTMYCVHRITNNEEIEKLWHVGSEFTINDEIDSRMCQNVMYSNPLPYLTLSDGTKERIDILAKNIVSNFENYKPIDVCAVLKELYENHINSLIDCREVIYENSRKNKYHYLPSRMHSIWLCDKEDIESWQYQLGDNTKTYEVNVTGTLFKTSDIYLSRLNSSINDSLNMAEKYWNHDSKPLGGNTEYLFQGDVKVICEINTNKLITKYDKVIPVDNMLKIYDMNPGFVKLENIISWVNYWYMKNYEYTSMFMKGNLSYIYEQYIMNMVPNISYDEYKGKMDYIEYFYNPNKEKQRTRNNK